MARKSLLNKNPVKAESVVPDKPVRIAEATLGQSLTHMHLAQFYQNEDNTQGKIAFML